MEPSARSMYCRYIMYCWYSIHVLHAYEQLSVLKDRKCYLQHTRSAHIQHSPSQPAGASWYCIMMYCSCTAAAQYCSCTNYLKRRYTSSVYLLHSTAHTGRVSESTACPSYTRPARRDRVPRVLHAIKTYLIYYLQSSCADALHATMYLTYCMQPSSTVSTAYSNKNVAHVLKQATTL